MSCPTNHIRPARLDDIPVLLELEQAVVDAERPYNNQIKVDGVTYYDLEQLINSETSRLLVACEGEQILATGYARIENSRQPFKHEKHGYLGFMYVKPEKRGQGLNGNIVEALIEWAKGKQIYDFYLDVYADNQAAVKAYEKMGFTANLVEMKLNL